MSYDAIIVGAGHNGLVTGIYLAKAGWKVLILERNSEAGGAVKTAEITLPGFRHDLFATNLNLFAGSPFLSGIQNPTWTATAWEFAPVQHPFCSVFPDGSYAGVSADLETTVRSISALSADDADAWRRLVTEFPDTAAHLFPAIGPSACRPLGLARALYRGFRAQGQRLGIGDCSPAGFIDARVLRTAFHRCKTALADRRLGHGTWALPRTWPAAHCLAISSRWPNRRLAWCWVEAVPTI